MLAFAAFLGLIIGLFFVSFLIEVVVSFLFTLSDEGATVVRRLIEYGLLALFIQHYLS